MKKKWIAVIIIVLIIVILLGVIEFKKESLDKTEDEITNTVQNVTNTNTAEPSEIKDTLSINEKRNMATETIEKCLVLVDYNDLSAVKAMPFILDELGFVSRDDLQEFFEKTEPDEDGYYKTEVKYDDFKSKMLEYVSSDYFENNYKGYHNIDGYVGVVNTGIGIPLCHLENIESVEYQGNGEYLCKAIIRDEEVYDHYLNPDEGDTISENDCYFNWKAILKRNGDRLVLEKLIWDEEI